MTAVSPISSRIAAWLCAAALLIPVRAEQHSRREPQPPKIPARIFSIVSYGAVGDGKTMNTEAIQAAIQACAKAGGGRVAAPPGIYLSGPIELASHMALVLEKGAVLQASDKFSDFGLPDPLPSTQFEIDALKRNIRPLISGSKLEDVAILGEGIIDGAGAVWWAKSDKASERAASLAPPAPPAKTGESTPAPAKPLYVPRPHLIVLRDCARVLVQGISLANSPMFHLVPARCHDVLVEDVDIHSPADSPNTDGIDPANCRDVMIRRCKIDTGDDNIALKAGAGGGYPTENVMVTDCKFLHGHGVSIGSEVQTGVRHFIVQNCSFENTGTALRIKSDRTRGGVVEDIVYRDITMKNVESAITIFLFYDNKKTALSPDVKPITGDTPIIHDIHFLNIVCEGVTRKAGEIVGLPESPVSDVTIENVRITGAPGGFTQQDVKRMRFINVDVQTPALTAAESKPTLP